MSSLKSVILIFLGLVGVGALLLYRSYSADQAPTTTGSSSSSSSTTSLNPFVLPGPKVGEKMPEYSLNTIDGVSLTSANGVGKIRVFTSSATWCPTCIIENKEFQPVYQEVKDRGVEFITVDIDPITTPEAIETFQRVYAPWHNVMLAQAQELIDDLVMNRFEITYIVDKQGVIRFKDGQITSTETLREELGKLL